jgi:sugar O-acyltransferase (sialic acid O-acetyltransferase NeuD family)
MPSPANAVPVLVPLLNPNEPEARLVSLAVQEGQQVSAGTSLCTLETTKSTAEVLAEADGYVRGLRVGEGDLVNAGEVLAYIASTPDWPIPEVVPPPTGVSRQLAGSEAGSELPPGLRLTRPALALARRAGLDLQQLPVGPLLTETMIQGLITQSKPGPPEAEIDPSAVIVFGGGGHGKTIIELLQAIGNFRITGIIDDGIPAGEKILGIEVLGGAQALPALYRQGIRQAINAVGGISSPAARRKVFELLAQEGFSCPALAHPSAVVEPSAVLSDGVQVFSHAYIGSQARLGFGVIANTGVVVSHDCVVEDYANLSPGALLAGGVRVGQGALIGMGVTVNLGVAVGAGARLGNGATVISDVPQNGIVKAGTRWPD